MQPQGSEDMSTPTEQNAAWFAEEEYIFVRNIVISLPIMEFSSPDYFRGLKGTL